MPEAIKIICKKCGHDGDFIEEIEYDTFKIIRCPKCGFVGVFKGEQTSDFKITKETT